MEISIIDHGRHRPSSYGLLFHDTHFAAVYALGAVVRSSPCSTGDTQEQSSTPVMDAQELDQRGGKKYSHSPCDYYFRLWLMTQAVELLLTIFKQSL
jgi:hypothetical protein